MSFWRNFIARETAMTESERKQWVIAKLLIEKFERENQHIPLREERAEPPRLAEFLLAMLLKVPPRLRGVQLSPRNVSTTLRQSKFEFKLECLGFSAVD
jgi:hypothetical protein